MHGKDGTAYIGQKASSWDSSTIVPCRPLGSIFREYNVTWIDFFSLDVEGHEAEVLHTIDFKHTQIGVLMVETDRLGTDTEAAARAKMIAVDTILSNAGMHKVGSRFPPSA